MPARTSPGGPAEPTCPRPDPETMTRRAPDRRDTAATALPLAAMVALLALFAGAIWLMIDSHVETLEAAATVTAPVEQVVEVSVTDE